MTKRALLLIVPIAIAAVLAGAFALRPTAEAPSAPAPQTVEEAPAEEAAGSEPAPIIDPVFAVRSAPAEVALKAEVAPQTATLIVEGKTLPVRSPEGATIEDAMAALKAEGSLDYKVRAFTGLGAFVEEIEGKASTSEYYWILHVNGKKSATGISATRISSGDVIEWKYEKKY